MHTTLRQLDRAFAAIATSHDQLADYFWGDWPDAFHGVVRKYALLVVNVPSPFVFDKNINTITINIIVADQVARDKSNLKDVESDTLQILEDIYKIITKSPNWNKFCAVKTVTGNLKFKDATPDEVYGWQMTLQLKLINTRCLTDIPLDDYDFNKEI